jgi:hypothetical protein
MQPTIEHVSVSKLRQLSAANLRELRNVLVVETGNMALAVVVPYYEYLAMQNELEKALCVLVGMQTNQFSKERF